MKIAPFGSKDGVKKKDIKDVEKRTTELIKELMKIHDQLVGNSPTTGLVNLTRIVIRDPHADEFRQELDKLIAKISSNVDRDLKEIVKILSDLNELKEAGQDVIMIRDEDQMVGNLENGFTIINDQLLQMTQKLKSILQMDSIDREGAAMQVVSHYITIVEELKQLHPVEKQLEQLYKVVDDVI